jgi:hypothetical protein
MVHVVGEGHVYMDTMAMSLTRALHAAYQLKRYNGCVAMSPPSEIPAVQCGTELHCIAQSSHCCAPKYNANLTYKYYTNMLTTCPTDPTPGKADINLRSICTAPPRTS